MVAETSGSVCVRAGPKTPSDAREGHVSKCRNAGPVVTQSEMCRPICRASPFAPQTIPLESPRRAELKPEIGARRRRAAAALDLCKDVKKGDVYTHPGERRGHGAARNLAHAQASASPGGVQNFKRSR
jgi:hypothetical protein